MTSWSFLTSHARVLLVIDSNPDIRLREIAEIVGITERRAYDIVADLTTTGYLEKRRAGRRNLYEVHRHRRINDDLADHRTVGDILTLLTDTTTAEEVRPGDRATAS